MDEIKAHWAQEQPKQQAKRRRSSTFFGPSVYLHVSNYFKGHLFLSNHCLKKWGRWGAGLFYTTINVACRLDLLCNNERLQQTCTIVKPAGERRVPGDRTARCHLHRDWFFPPTQTKESPLSTYAVAQIALFKLLPLFNHPRTPPLSYFTIYGFGKGRNQKCKTTWPTCLRKGTNKLNTGPSLSEQRAIEKSFP